MTQTEIKVLLNPSVQVRIDNALTPQAAYKENNGKHEQKPKDSIMVAGYEMFYETHEYVAPTGVGYTLIFTCNIDGADWARTESRGVEGESRTADWTEIIEDDLI